MNITPVKKHLPMNDLEYAAHQARLDRMQRFCYAFQDRGYLENGDAHPIIETRPGSRETAENEYNAGHAELMKGGDRNRVYLYVVQRRERIERPLHHKTTYRYQWGDRPGLSEK